MDYSVGDKVVYGGTGIFSIESIEDISMNHYDRPQKYYVLKALFASQSQTAYVPVNNEKAVSRMKPVISKEEALELIDSLRNYSIEWIDDRNERKRVYDDIILYGSRKEITDVISLILSYKASLNEAGKKLNMQDEKILLEAERRMNNEFAVALGITPDEVVDLIYSKIERFQ